MPNIGKDPTVPTRIVCKDWNDFIHLVRSEAFGPERASHTSPRYFRGHANAEWKLASTWERALRKFRQENPGDDLERTEVSRFLESFKHHAIGLPGFDSFDLKAPDWWALARHHGMLTPLLDWSRSPFVAAFFAITEAFALSTPDFKSGTANIILPKEPVIVWCLVGHANLFKEGEFKLHTKRTDTMHRQRAQQGVFTELSHDKHLDVESYLAERQMAQLLEQIEIPGHALQHALHDLNRMNINFATVFPDLTGAAMQANFHLHFA